MGRNKTRLVLGKTRYKSSIEDIKLATAAIDASVKKLNEAILGLQEILEPKKNIPFLSTILLALLGISSHITKIQNMSAEIQRNIVLIDQVTKEYVEQLEAIDNGDTDL